MEALAKGTVVLIPFPFSDLSKAKLRPALVLAVVAYSDLVLCQITSNPYSDPLAVKIGTDNFATGSLQRDSYARPCKLFTANTALIQACAGQLTPEITGKIVDVVVSVLTKIEG